MVAIIDYGVGNLFSLSCSVQSVGEKCLVTADPQAIHNAERIILPGVGAFRDAANKLRSTGLDEVVLREAQAGKPLLGVCLGMQLLFEKSMEYGEHSGLGLIKGSVRPIADFIPAGLKIPHIGWNELIFPTDKPKSPLFKYVDEGQYVYFVHSYCGAQCEQSVIAVTQYGALITAAVAGDNVYGCQFHPEKSGQVGLKILKAFCEVRSA